MHFLFPDGRRKHNRNPVMDEIDAALVFAKNNQRPPASFNADYEGNVAISRDYLRTMYTRAMGRRSPFFKNTRKQRGRK